MEFPFPDAAPDRLAMRNPDAVLLDSPAGRQEDGSAGSGEISRTIEGAPGSGHRKNWSWLDIKF
jgi:hypothetical protein